MYIRCKTSQGNMETWIKTSTYGARIKMCLMSKPGEYELWRMRMEHYIQKIDYSLWEVIENGNVPSVTKDVEGNFMPPKPNLSFSGLEEFVNEPIVSEPTVKKHVVKTSEAKDSVDKPKAVRKNNGAPAIEDWVTDSEEEDVPQANDSKENIVNTAKPKAVLNAVKGNQVNVVKGNQCINHSKKGNPQMDLQDQGVIDSGCSRYMTWNMSYLTDFEEIDGGYVAFGGNPKRGKITGRESKLWQICKIPSVDLKNIIHKGGLTCLFAKATSDESKLWHRRLGHINFKTMNKLVKGNLVRGLPSKLFENDQTCVACQKGKQHRASYDYSRFSWVFFLATKDETSGILKSFITRVENLIDQRVNAIRCDNGTEFKNKEMNHFYERKDIKREFSVARTPQQNRVAERRNRTLIEAVRTMLANSKLPTTFWAEAVNTACYVQNKVLVTKSHNKTPYELFLGRKPALGFMRPFECPVTILNTIDHLGKFDGKADEGFFVGYLINSKTFRVFNSRTRIVEENLHVQFIMNTPNIAGSRPNWLFDIDALTKSMNYKPVIAGNPSNGNTSTKACDDAGKEGGDPRNEGDKVDKEKNDSVNSTNNINTASDRNNNNNVNNVSSTINTASIEVNAVSSNTSIELPNDPNMPKLEDIVYSDDYEHVGAEADMNNLDTFMTLCPFLSKVYTKIIQLNKLLET
ncbi:putative ribonuclease H-like domain-containing protein [Tanacetum coccineum]